MKKRGSIELSVSFLVVAILSLAMMGLGIVLVKNMTDQNTKIQTVVDDQMKLQIMKLLDNGDKVSIPFLQLKVGRGDTPIFGVGVLNTLSTQGFTVTAEFACSAYDKNKVAIPTPEKYFEIVGATVAGPCGTKKFPTTFSIKQNGKQVYSIPIKMLKTAKPGTYIFKVTVKDSTNAVYGDPEYRLYVIVN
jgi:hypothetical protein